MTIIVTKFGKSRYNCLPMDMCASIKIFQDKVGEITSDIEDVKPYIDELLVSSKDLSTNQIEKLRIIFRRLRAAGLNVMLLSAFFSFKIFLTWDM